MEPECPICHGTKFVRTPPFGRAVACECQNEFLHLTWLGRLPQHRTFADFRPWPYQSEALAAAQAFGAGTGQPWLLLMGDNGTGKTHLALAALIARAERGQRGAYWKPADLMDYLREDYREGVDEGRGRMTSLRQSPYPIVLDDFGKQKVTEWVAEKLFQLLDWRYEQELPTILTTNLMPGAIDPSLASRMFDRRVVARVVLVGPDMRKEKL